MHKDIEEVLITEKQLQKKVEELGRQITHEYQGRTMLLLCVLKGALMFMADLARAIDLPLEMDFMVVSSYGSATESSGVVRIVKDLEEPIEGKHVLLVEDIVDSGLTLHYLLDVLRTRKPASLRVCTLIDKVKEREKVVTPDYMGFQVADRFVVGYGLDYAQRYRNLPYIGVLKPEVYQDALDGPDAPGKER
ncbi:MAG TPA: hypoxanthine phosphoribosyltransferase [Ktedonobacterales bacterium]|nr:hypoxanthine phosphoribosyltransferase [Ktedonobacterales bacterium]